MKIINLSSIANPISISVQNPSRSDYDRFIGLEHYDSGEPVITRFQGTELLTTSAKAFKANDILIARRNVYLKRAGIVFFDGITSGDSIILRLKEDTQKTIGYSREDLIRYIPFMLNSEHFWIYANKHADGMNSKRISKDTLLEYEFELPSIDEMRDISDKLWAAYRLKEAYKKLLVTTDEMVKSQFIEMYYNTHNKQTLESVCPIMSKGITPKYVESSSVLVINQACIHWDGQRLGNIKYHNEEIPVRKRILESGDVLLNATGNGTLGRCCVFICPSDNNTYINDGHVIALSTDRAVILPEVLNTYLSLNDTQAEIYRQYVTGSTNQVDIVFSDIKKMKVPVPSMDEQILFVEVLKQADKSKFGDFKSQFIEMFGNPVTNTKGWKTAKIKDVAPEMPSKEQLSGKIWLLNLDMIESNTGRIIEKVYEDVENALSVQSFDEGNVLFSKLRPYLNKVVIPDEPGMATTELVPLRPEPSKLHKVFLSHLLRGNQFVNYANDIAGGTKMPRMPLTELRNFDCILPPMDKQLEFVFIAEQVDKSKFELKQCIEHIDKVIKSLING